MTPREQAAAILHQWGDNITGDTGGVEDDITAALQTARRQALEDACRVTCYFCAEGIPVERAPDGYWFHPPVAIERRGYRCSGHTIRLLMQSDQEAIP